MDWGKENNRKKREVKPTLYWDLKETYQRCLVLTRRLKVRTLKEQSIAELDAQTSNDTTLRGEYKGASTNMNCISKHENIMTFPA